MKHYFYNYKAEQSYRTEWKGSGNFVIDWYMDDQIIQETWTIEKLVTVLGLTYGMVKFVWIIFERLFAGYASFNFNLDLIKLVYFT